MKHMRRTGRYRVDWIIRGKMNSRWFTNIHEAHAEIKRHRRAWLWQEFA